MNSWAKRFFYFEKKYAKQIFAKKKELSIYIFISIANLCATSFSIYYTEIFLHKEVFFSKFLYREALVQRNFYSASFCTPIFFYILFGKFLALRSFYTTSFCTENFIYVASLLTLPQSSSCTIKLLYKVNSYIEKVLYR